VYRTIVQEMHPRSRRTPLLYPYPQTHQWFAPLWNRGFCCAAHFPAPPRSCKSVPFNSQLGTGGGGGRPTCTPRLTPSVFKLARTSGLRGSLVSAAGQKVPDSSVVLGAGRVKACLWFCFVPVQTLFGSQENVRVAGPVCVCCRVTLLPLKMVCRRTAISLVFLPKKLASQLMLMPRF